jgi:hypothetical protein
MTLILSALDTLVWRLAAFISLVCRSNKLNPKGEVIIPKGWGTYQKGEVPYQKGEVPYQKGEVPYQKGEVPYQKGEVSYQKGEYHTKKNYPNGEKLILTFTKVAFFNTTVEKVSVTHEINSFMYIC